MKEDNLLFVFGLVFTLACLQKKNKTLPFVIFIPTPWRKALGTESHTGGLAVKIYPDKMGRPFKTKLCHQWPLT